MKPCRPSLAKKYLTFNRLSSNRQSSGVCFDCPTCTSRARSRKLSRTRPQIIGLVFRSTLSVTGLVVTALIAGCGDSKFQYAPVSGQVLLDGNPVPNARITFMPSASGQHGEAGPYSNGETDEEGRFQLESVDDDPTSGAVVGSHRVIVSTKRSHLDPSNPDIEIIDKQEVIPFPFNDYRKTPLVFDLTPEGSETADFAIESSKKRR